MDGGDLEKLWSDLKVPVPPTLLNATRISGLPLESPVYIAVDGSRRRHLLVVVREGTPAVTRRATRGLDVTTERLQVGGAPEATFIDLACLDPLQHQTFSAVSVDILTSLRSPGNAGPRDAVVSSLDRWRWFWSLDPEGLSRDAELGLFGELWFLDRWIGCSSRDVLERWTGPSGSRHDFQSAAVSVEVKATAAADPVRHRISNLEQLDDPDTGRLFLYSLQARDDELAANSLPSLVHRLRTGLESDLAALLLFDEKLALAGYNPAFSDRYARTLRINSEALYRVEDQFPRLTAVSFATGVPAGVDGITYSLSLSACDRWRVATSPQDRAAKQIREAFRELSR